MNKKSAGRSLSSDAMYAARHVAYCDALEKGSGVWEGTEETRSKVMTMLQVFFDITFAWSDNDPAKDFNPLFAMRKFLPQYKWELIDCDNDSRYSILRVAGNDLIFSVSGGFVVARNEDRQSPQVCFLRTNACGLNAVKIFEEFDAVIVPAGEFHLPKDDLILMGIYGREMGSEDNQLFFAGHEDEVSQ